MNLHDEIKNIMDRNVPSMVSETNRRLAAILDRLPPKLCLGDKPAPVKKLFCYHMGWETVRFVAYDLEEANRFYDAFVYEQEGISRLEHEDNGWSPDRVYVHKEDDSLTIREEEDSPKETKTVAEWLAGSECGFFSMSFY